MFCILGLYFSIEFLYAGDVANFVNLGFSRDGSYFTFAQYGYTAVSGQAYGSVVTVDLLTNEFVRGSAIDERKPYYPTPGPGGFPEGILYILIERYISNRERFDIDYTLHGRLLYNNSSDLHSSSTKVNSLEDESTDCFKSNSDRSDCLIGFDDFRTNIHYGVTLKQDIEGGNTKDIRSTFRLDLVVQFPTGITKNYHVGHPNFIRKGVLGYEIDSVILTPDEKGLVFVVAKKFYSGSDICVRYMVETIIF